MKGCVWYPRLPLDRIGAHFFNRLDARSSPRSCTSRVLKHPGTGSRGTPGFAIFPGPGMGATKIDNVVRARTLECGMAGEGEIRAPLHGKGRGNLPLQFPPPLVPSQKFSLPNFGTGGGYLDLRSRI
jgi:hypothetical protein